MPIICSLGGVLSCSSCDLGCQRVSGIGESSGKAAGAAYQPPALVVLGSVHTLTLGAVGSMLDSNGRGSHGNKEKCKPKPAC